MLYRTRVQDSEITFFGYPEKKSSQIPTIPTLQILDWNLQMITMTPPYCLGSFRKPAFRTKNANFSIIFWQKTSPIYVTKNLSPVRKNRWQFFALKSDAKRFPETRNRSSPDPPPKQRTACRRRCKPPWKRPSWVPPTVAQGENPFDYQYQRFCQKTSFKACTGLVKAKPMNHMETMREISCITNPACLHRQDQPTSSLRADKEGKPSLVPLNPVATSCINSRSNPETTWAWGKFYS